MTDFEPVDDPGPVDLDSRAAGLTEYWSQETVGSANGSQLRVAKGTGSTHWHAHDDQDEVFLVTAGELIIELRSGEVSVGPGQLFIVPKGVEHRPRAETEARFLIIGTTITSNAAGGKPDWSEDGGKPPSHTS